MYFSTQLNWIFVFVQNFKVFLIKYFSFIRFSFFFFIIVSRFSIGNLKIKNKYPVSVGNKKVTNVCEMQKKRRNNQSEERRVRKPSSNFNVFELIPVSILKHPSAWRCRINISFKIDLATSIYPFLFLVASKGKRIFFCSRFFFLFYRWFISEVWSRQFGNEKIALKQKIYYIKWN